MKKRKPHNGWRLFADMSAASTLNFKVECLLDGKLVSFVQRFAPSDLVSTVLQVAATQLSLNPSEWNVCRDPGGTQVLAPSTTLESHCFPKSTKIYLGKVTDFSSDDYGFCDCMLTCIFASFACRSGVKRWFLSLQLSQAHPLPFLLSILSTCCSIKNSACRMPCLDARF